jgi:hypothetical protein
MKYSKQLGLIIITFIICLLIPTKIIAETNTTEYYQDPVPDFNYYVGWYDEKRTNSNGSNYTHKGLDIVGAKGGDIDGAAVYPSLSGKIVQVGWDASSIDQQGNETGNGGGYMVVVEHENNKRTYYMHLYEDSSPYEVGQKVELTDIIGFVDTTGNAKGSHLHYTIKINGEKVDPAKYLDWAKYRCRASDCYKDPHVLGDDINLLKLIYAFTDEKGGPGGDNPDDTYSVSDAVFPSIPIDLEKAFYRLAARKGNSIVLDYYVLKELIKERDYYLESIPDGSLPDQVYLERLNTEISQLYESFGLEQELFWREYVAVPDVTVLENGYIRESKYVINRFFEPVRVTSPSFNPLYIKIHPILVIPSGGLYGLEDSVFFKASLDEYVKQGGTLIVFAQQHGYEFSAIPVPQEEDGTYRQIKGYGWGEDQACFTNGTYINTWHQILAGQGRSTPTLNVDGYFSSYPSNTEIMLRRTANGQPALIMYEHG